MQKNDDRATSAPLDLEAIEARSKRLQEWREARSFAPTDGDRDRVALIAEVKRLRAAVERVEAQCGLWIEQDEQCRRDAERWQESGGEPYAAIAYEEYRDCARAIIAAINGDAK